VLQVGCEGGVRDGRVVVVALTSNKCMSALIYWGLSPGRCLEAAVGRAQQQQQEVQMV
jgi:hypothetical protein